MARTIAFDTETHLIAPGRLAPKLICLSYCERVGMPRLASAAEGVELFRQWITDPEVLLVAHNATFDLGVMVQADPSLMRPVFEAVAAGRVGCTQLRDRQRMIAEGWGKYGPDGKPAEYHLSNVVERLLGDTVEGKGEDAWRMRYHELEDTPISDWPSAAVEYATLDAEYCLRVWQALEREEFGLTYLAEQVQAAWALHLMSAWGVRTDPAQVQVIERKLHRVVDGAIDGMTPHQFTAVAEEMGWPERLREPALAGLMRLGIYRGSRTRNMAKIKAMVREAYDDNPPETDGGDVSTSREVLEGTNNPALQLLAAIGTLQQVKRQYFKHLQRGTRQVLNPRYRVILESSRTSCSKPSVQVLPRMGGVRECFVPPDGWVQMACDYHVAEMCSLAQVLVESFGESKMADAINAGRKLHLETAAGILGWSYEDTVAAYKAGDAQAKYARQLAKVANFGFPGGLMPRGMVDYAAGYGVTITHNEAHDLREAWLDRYPEMVLYFEGIADMVAAGHGEYTYADPVSGFVRGGISYNDGCNHPFQHRVSVGAKKAAWLIAREAYTDPDSTLYGIRPWGFIHDEVIADVPRARAVAAAPRFAELMVHGLQSVCPDVKITADAHLMPRWYKDAEPVYIDGRLALWTPEGAVAV